MGPDERANQIRDILGVPPLTGEQRDKIVSLIIEVHDEGYACAEKHAASDYDDE